MNIRRITAVSTMAVAGALLVSACGASNSSTTAATATTTPTPVATGNPTSTVTLTEDGSSLLYPYLEELETPLNTAYPNITLNPAAGGSGKGQSDAETGAVNMGGSDAYLSNGAETEYSGILNIPIAVSAQAVDYNLPGISDLKLSGNIIAQIYQGSITKWNDSAISALNRASPCPRRPSSRCAVWTPRVTPPSSPRSSAPRTPPGEAARTSARRSAGRR